MRKEEKSLSELEKWWLFEFALYTTKSEPEIIDNTITEDISSEATLDCSETLIVSQD